MTAGRRKNEKSRSDYIPRNARSPIPKQKRMARQKKKNTSRGRGNDTEGPSQYPERALNAYPKRSVFPIQSRVRVKKSPGRPLGFRMIGPPQMPPSGMGMRRNEKGNGRPGNSGTLKRDRRSEGMSTPSSMVVDSKKAKPTAEEERGRSRKRTSRPGKSIDSRTVDRVPTQGTRMQPVAITRKAPPIAPKGGAKKGGKGGKKKKFARPLSQAEA